MGRKGSTNVTFLMAYVCAYFFLILALCQNPASAQHNTSNLIKPGFSLSPTIAPTSWLSPSGRFAFGFHPQRSGFVVAIWLVNEPNNIITWTAFRDDPLVSSNASLMLTMDGNLLLKSGEDRVIAKTNESATNALMLNSGNFVLYNEESDVIWESFRFPTDTILGGQYLHPLGALFSRVSFDDLSTGKFCLKMQEDDNLVLYPVNTLESSIFAYWASGTYSRSNFSSAHLYLNYTGELLIIRNHTARIAKYGSYSDDYSIIHRAVLDDDGFFRLYSHSFNNNVINSTLVWFEPEKQCDVKGFCGFNSYCTMNDAQPECICIPGTDWIDPNQSSRGCEKNYTEELCKGAKEIETSYNITETKGIICDDLPYSGETMSEEDCRKSCLEDCYCAAVTFTSGKCMKQQLPLKYARRYVDDSTKVFFKVGMKSISTENNSTSVLTMPSAVIKRTSKKTVMLISVVSLLFITWLLVALSVSGYYMFKLHAIKSRMLLESGNFGLTLELTLRAYSYGELKKATNGFREELGKGSFGAVYKGTLCKGKRLIAVKRLERVVNEGEREFLTEMHAIGKTYHKNLVRLLGYCNEDSNRLLVYEYMSNGSLGDLLFGDAIRPNWDERVKIGIDVAKGILYLHEECEAPIIHCDIKPQNILMDDFWNAKISDFGLAKLLVPDQTRTFTIIRGTRGYLAPEWYKNTPISVKADVYSYGVVLLEIVCCRKNLDITASNPEEIVLCNWVYECFLARELDKLVPGQEIDRQNLEKMVMVGLWCIQDEPALRPSMKSVVMMLEGITDVAVPPHPTTRA